MMEKLKQLGRALATPILLISGAIFGGTFGYYLGSWFQIALGQSIPSNTPTLFGLLGFILTGAGMMYVMGQE